MKALCQVWGTNTFKSQTLPVRKHMLLPILARHQFLRCTSAHSVSFVPNLKWEDKKRRCRLVASSASLQASESFGEEQGDQPHKSRLATFCKFIALGLAVFAWLKISVNRPASLFCSATVATSSTQGGKGCFHRCQLMWLSLQNKTLCLIPAMRATYLA